MVEPIKAKLPLSLADVEKRFGDELVLDGVSMDLEPGSITGLLGRNASGKTTLIRTAIGLLEPDLRWWNAGKFARNRYLV